MFPESGPKLTVVASSPTEVKDAIKQVGTGRVIRAEFESLLDAYNLNAPDGLYTNGNAIGYRQVKIPGWPEAVHYEFLDRGGEPARIGVELHVENGKYPDLCDSIESLVVSLANEFPGVEFSRKWMKGCRLVVLIPFAESDAAVQTMKLLISATRATVQARLGEIGSTV